MLPTRLIKRTLSYTANNLAKQTPNNLKGKKHSSQQWLVRQLSDPYVERAKMMNFRCRSAFKLIEIDDRFKLLANGHTVVDCGAAPGSWTQVAVERTNSNGYNSTQPVGTVVSIDRQHFHPIDGATILGNSDFTLPDTQEQLKHLLAHKKVDVVLSDMAPNASGVRAMDVENILNLCYSVLRFAVQFSSLEATLLVKLWQSGESKTLENDILKFYKSTKFVKPESSRSDSAEMFLLARGFKGIKNNA